MSLDSQKLSQPSLDVWQVILNDLHGKITEESILTWFEPLKLLKISETDITLQVPNQFHIDWLDSHYSGVLSAAIRRTVGKDLTIKYQIEADDYQSHDDLASFDTFTPAISAPRTNGGINSNLNDKFTFDNFIEGECNRFARAAAFSLAEAPGKTPYNPLMVYGSSGLGKTHIIQAIGNYIVQNDLAHKVMYITSEQFTTDFIEAIKNRKGENFTKLYRGVDVLLLDDVQFFMAKDRTQEEFFHTFNSLEQAGKQIVFSSDRPPHELKGFNERLISRLQWGLVCEIHAPEYETRLAIIHHLTKTTDCELPKEVANFLATNLTENIRSIEGAITYIAAQSSFMGVDITIDLARNSLRNFVNRPIQPVSVSVIQDIVSAEFGIPSDLLRSKTRKKNIVEARHIAMFLTNEFTDLTLKGIGLHFGGRDHGTVIHARKCVEDQIRNDNHKAKLVDQLRQKIRLSSL